MNSTRNYHAHGGNEWVIGGKLTFAFAQDLDRMKGAFGAAGASKLRTMYQMAII